MWRNQPETGIVCLPANGPNDQAQEASLTLKHVTKCNITVTCYSALMSVAYGKNGKEAGLDGQIIPANKPEEIADR